MSSMQQQDLLFCQQYSLHLLLSDSEKDQQKQLARDFVDRFPLTSSSISQSRDWTEADKARFESTANRLLQPTLTTVLSKMFSIPRLSFFFAAGLLGTGLIRSVSAMPLTDLEISGPIARGVDMHYKGEFTDTTTGKPFDLYVMDSSLDPATAFSHYLAGANGTGIHKRSWYDCKHLSNLQTLGCNTGHGIGNFVSATGSAAAGSYIGTLLSEAFNGKRDNKNPRSICLSRDGDNLCVSWATYDTAKLKSGEATDIENFSVMCGQSKGSAEFKTVMSDGGILYICVSNRADGCGTSVC